MSSTPGLVVAPPSRWALRPLVGLRFAVRLAVRALLGFAIVIALAVTVPGLVWHSTFTVLSGSMTPTLRVGDVVVDKRIRPLQAHVGDIVTFRAPDDPSRLYTHRVVKMGVSGDTVTFVTRGDANTGVEKWSVPADGSIGRVLFHVPLVGYVADRAGSRFGRLGLIVVPAAALGLVELVGIWRRKEDE